MAGNYSHHFDVEEEKEPDSQGEYVEDIDEKPTDLKPLVQETEVKGSSEGSRSELYEEIQELNDMANLSVSEKFTDQNSADPEKMEKCPNCGLRVKNLQKHTVIEKCGLYPYPFSKSCKKGRE